MLYHYQKKKKEVKINRKNQPTKTNQLWSTFTYFVKRKFNDTNGERLIF